MPTISKFHGITIIMYFEDHEPPHFHVRHGGQRAVFTIDPPRPLRGVLSAQATGMVTEWAALHQAELRENWQRVHNLEPGFRIPPLA